MSIHLYYMQRSCAAFAGTPLRFIQEPLLPVKQNTQVQLSSLFLGFESLPAVCMYATAPTPSFKMYKYAA